MLVEIWSDVVCPWCYIGKRRFEKALARFEHADRVEIRWRSFELDPRAPRRREGGGPEHLARKYGMTVGEAEARLSQMDELAAAEGLAYDLAHTQGGNTFDAHRLVHHGYSKDPSTGAAMKEALLHAYFTDLQPIGEPETLLDAGANVGFDRGEIAQLLQSDQYADDVRRDEREASELGCSGVPFFVVDRAFAVPGAQDPDTLLITLRRAWDRAHPDLVDEPGTGDICTGDACEL
jgi:predicted DsbA family dithiol-disulfide isomerase